jgi:hypothetical protein
VRYREIPPPGTPLPMLDLSDMDRVHRMIAIDQLADTFIRLAGGQKRLREKPYAAVDTTAREKAVRHLFDVIKEGPPVELPEHSPEQ